MREMAAKLDKEKAKRNIEVILDKIHGDTDLALLREYHSIFKKEISLFSRKWAAAWLLMYYDKKEIPVMRTDKPDVSKKPDISKNVKTPAPEEKSLSPSASLPEEESKKLFISIGKNRRLFPREMLSIIMSKTSAAKEDVGMIRILDNYSFVQVRDSKADEIIKALNGTKFRGRTITVNYAKPKNNDE
jgi:hypothetical protein